MPTTPADEARAARLRRAREMAHYKTAAAAADRFHWKKPTYHSHENGTRGFKFDKAELYAKSFRVSVYWLAFGIGAPLNNGKLTIQGKLGVGAFVMPFDESDKPPNQLQEVELPPGVSGDFAAYKVDGDINYPAFFNGDVLICPLPPGAPSDYIGQQCVVEFEDGRRAVRVIAAGTVPDRFMLVGFNAPPLADQALNWAMPVRWIRRGA